MRRTNSNNFGLPPPAMDNSRHHTDGLGQSSTTTSSGGGGGGGASRRRARKQAEMSDIEFQKLQAFLERTGFDCGEAATRRAQRRTTPTSSKDSSPFGDVLDHYPFHHSFDGLNTSKSSFASSREDSIMSAPVRTNHHGSSSSSHVMSTPRTTNGRRYTMRNSPTTPINGQIIGSMMLPDPKPTDFPGVNLTPSKPLNTTAATNPATTSKKKKKNKSKKKKMKRRSSAPELSMQAAARLAALELEDEDDSGHNYQPKPRKKDDFDDFFAARRSSKTAMDLFNDVQRGRDEHQAEQDDDDDDEEEERRRTEFSSSLHNPQPSLLMTPRNGRDPRHKSLSPEATLNPLWSASSSSSKKNVRRRRHSLTHQTSLPVDYERSDSGMLLGTKSIDYSERTSATSVMTGSSASPAVRRRSFAQIAPPISIHVSDSSSSSPVSPPTPPASKFGMGGGGSGGPGGGGSSLSPEQQISQYHGQMLRSFLQQKGQDAQNASSVAAAFETFLKNQKDIVEQLAGTTSASMSPSNGDNGGVGWEGESNLRSPAAAAAAVPHSPAPQYDEKERMVLDMLYEHQQKRQQQQQQQQAQQQPAPPTPQQQQQQHHPHQPQKRRSSRTPAWNRHGTIAHYEKSSRAIDSGFGDMRRNESFVRRKSKDQLFISEEDQQELARLAGE